MKRDLLGVVDELYSAALEPARWESALTAVSDTLDAVGTTIIPLGSWTSVRSIASKALEDANREYQAGWWQHDLATARVMERGLRPGIVGTDRTVISEAEIRRSPFYQDFLNRHGIWQTMAAIAKVADDKLLSIGVQGGARRSLFQQEDLDTLATLAPHLARAVSITTTLVETRGMTADLAEALHRVDLGVILLDPRGNVRHLNIVAEALQGDGLAIINRRVRAACREDDARLQAAIRSALPQSGHPPTSGIMLSRPDGKAPLYVELAPIPPRLDGLQSIAFSGGGAMLLIRDLEPKVRQLQHQLRALGLTPAEARLAEAIGQGATLRAFAERSSISYETARKHMRSIFSKLSIARQADLVSLVTRLSASLDLGK